MPFQCTKCGSTRIHEERVEVSSDRHVTQIAIEIHCVGCGEALVRPPTSQTVTHESLLAELCRENITDLTAHELGFLVSRPVEQVDLALGRMRRLGLVYCLELDLDDFEPNEGNGHWVAAGRIEVLRARALDKRFEQLHFDLGLDIAVNTDVEEARPTRV